MDKLDKNGFLLSLLPIGSEAVVREIPTDNRQRLLLSRLGFYPGACVEAVLRPVGSFSRAYACSGRVMALRKNDSDTITVTLCDEKS